MHNVSQVKAFLLNLQKNLVDALQVLEAQDPFLIDNWDRPQHTNMSGNGSTCILRHGKVFESAGVNFSHVTGDTLPQSASQRRPSHVQKFEALGISLVIHPQNPHVPTSHMNVRFFTGINEDEERFWWFGGGFDLTPYYPYEEDVIHWHQVAQNLCQPFGDEIYPCYKKWADEYFYLPHRQETRGVGGLFFDDLNTMSWGWDFETCFDFMQKVGSSFWQAYDPILQKRHLQRFTPHEREFQLYRRGRYVEFNLCYDRGTLFGLQSNGRTESILMSLPPRVSWEYQWQPTSGTPEAQLYERYLKPQNWLNLS